MFHKKNILGIVATLSTVTAFSITLGLGFQLISYYMIEQGFSAALIGYSGTAAGIATIIGAMSAAYLAICFGIGPILLATLIGVFLSILGFYLFSTVWIWFLLRFTLHFCSSILFVLAEFWLNQGAPDRRRGFILSLYAVLYGGGFIIGPALLTFIGWHGFRPFAFILILILLAILPILLSWKIAPRFHEHKRLPFIPYIFKAPTATMGGFMNGVIQMGVLTLLTKFSLIIGYTETQSAMFMVIFAFGSTFLSIPIGILNDHIKNKNYLLLFLAFLGFLGTAFIPFSAHNYLIFSALLFIIGGISAGLYTVGLVKLGIAFKDEALATANSAFAFCYGIGIMIGPAIIGKSTSLFEPYGFSVSMAIFFVLYMFLVWFQLGRSKIES